MCHNVIHDWPFEKCTCQSNIKQYCFVVELLRRITFTKHTNQKSWLRRHLIYQIHDAYVDYPDDATTSSLTQRQFSNSLYSELELSPRHRENQDEYRHVECMSMIRNSSSDNSHTTLFTLIMYSVCIVNNCHPIRSNIKAYLIGVWIYVEKRHLAKPLTHLVTYLPTYSDIELF